MDALSRRRGRREHVERAVRPTATAQLAELNLTNTREVSEGPWLAISVRIDGVDELAMDVLELGAGSMACGGEYKVPPAEFAEEEETGANEGSARLAMCDACDIELAGGRDSSERCGGQVDDEPAAQGVDEDAVRVAEVSERVS